MHIYLPKTDQLDLFSMHAFIDDFFPCQQIFFRIDYKSFKSFKNEICKMLLLINDVWIEFIYLYVFFRIRRKLNGIFKLNFSTTIMVPIKIFFFLNLIFYFISWTWYWTNRKKLHLDLQRWMYFSECDERFIQSIIVCRVNNRFDRNIISLNWFVSVSKTYCSKYQDDLSLLNLMNVWIILQH